ncbi:Hypothetical protein CAP_4768 [Chondromyces apiculatus DSM 436]|uniref:Secreted protein n=1 Tax=Chondromyces apiculatus DSM 436 TaxID=1192034 RepID=A0A017T5M2_9BACT|nr:Hypothetical protein CAP_4768 [Chondromyces apiculatus DSM 436]
MSSVGALALLARSAPSSARSSGAGATAPCQTSPWGHTFEAVAPATVPTDMASTSVTATRRHEGSSGLASVSMELLASGGTESPAGEGLRSGACAGGEGRIGGRSEVYRLQAGWPKKVASASREEPAAGRAPVRVVRLGHAVVWPLRGRT